MSNLVRTADYLAESLKKLDFVIMSEQSGRGLPLVAFRFKDAKEAGNETRHYDEFALAAHLRARGWVVPAYTMAPKTDGLKMLRVVVREDFTRPRADSLIEDIKLCMGLLEQMDRDTVKRQNEYLKTHVTHHGKEAAHKKHGYKVRLATVYFVHLDSQLTRYRTRSTRCRASTARRTPSAKRSNSASMCTRLLSEMNEISIVIDSNEKACYFFTSLHCLLSALFTWSQQTPPPG